MPDNPSLNRLYDLVRCPACTSPLTKSDSLTCTGCDARYPLLEGKFPVFLGPDEEISPAEQVEVSNLSHQAKSIHQSNWKVDYNVERISVLEGFLPDGLVLDVGAADGQIAAHLTTDSRIIYGVEKSPTWLSLHGSLPVPMIYCDIYRIPFGEQSFDGLVFGEILEHLYDPIEALKRTIPLLKPGGSLVGTVPNFYFYKKRLRYMAGGFGEDPDHPLTHEHIRLFSVPVLERMLRELGLVDIKIVGVWQRNVFPLLGLPDACKPLQTWLARWRPTLFAVTLVFHARRGS